MSKRLRSSEVCADCSAADPCWASINRGVLICDECCSVHRSLGRHISQVKHLKHTPWPSTLLQMVETLYNNGANSIWEHSLLDPASVMSGRRKANPQDKVHPNKAEFIRAKYQMLAFVHRLPCRDDDSVTAKDLSKQLHSSVRTGNLETCLRLLSLGAQANFFHPEKGNTPLHVAAKTGQILQAELLAVYGADPGTQDSSGKSPVDYAKQGGYHELAERLVEIQYELTDRLAFYLCGRRPDHKSGQHFIIPQMADSSLDLSELAKAAKKKLQSLSNHLFEELAMDVYDEVDRRETDAVWLATQNHSTLVTETTVVPFLPVNPEYSSTRNQGRQKLARFNAHEFATLVIDILGDAKRRQQGNPVPSSKENVELILKSISSQHSTESQENDQPDYDSVASDEEGDLGTSVAKAARQKSLDSDLSDGPVTTQEYLQIKNALVVSEAKIQQLLKVNVHLSDELRTTQKKLQTLQSENSTLRRQATPSAHQTPSGSEYADPGGHSSLKRRPSARSSRPMSMYETGSGQKAYLPLGEVSYPEEHVTARLQPFPAHIGRSGLVTTTSSSMPSFPSMLSWSRDESAQRASKLEKQSSAPEGDYDNAFPGLELDETGSSRKAKQRSALWQGEGLIPEGKDPDARASLPSTEDVIRKTEQITKNIQELLRAAQENKHDRLLGRTSVPKLRHSLGCFGALVPWAERASLQPLTLRQPDPTSCYIPCSERIHVAVTEMADLFSKKPKSELVRPSLRLLTASAYRLHSECKKTLPPESCPTADIQLVTQQVIQCAYDIAKAAKQLVTITTKENNN
ncbi:ARF GTPase-activating protein GIT2 isoform X15 [Sphaerodactylus townsendi]|uniref:ARF GTPase-activating protein GIT2 isoform X15 n=1 Tax=Sphaerodactylus townsendi TaxID=933632 RepID=UPI002026F15C|nr:ARF GTPase-activating protein GIT2 isoform X15 [Sphaerodactylus townsendi]